jgi:hypothetical protein
VNVENSRRLLATKWAAVPVYAVAASELPSTNESQSYSRHESQPPRKRLVKACTRRFRGNVTDIAATAMTIRDVALSAAERAFQAAPGHERAPGALPVEDLKTRHDAKR